MTGAKVVDNQLINTPVFSVLGYDGTDAFPFPQGAWGQIEKIQRAVLTVIRDFCPPAASFVFTNVLDAQALRYIGTLPKSAIIAGDPTSVDCVPIVSERPVVISRKLNQGLSPSYLHVASDAHGQARVLHASLRRLLELPDHVVLYPSHFGGSVCGRALSGNPISSIGFERTHNRLLALDNPEAFAAELLADLPPRPADQSAIVDANRAGGVTAPA